MITCFTYDDISPCFLSAPALRKLIDTLNNLDINSTLFVVPFKESTVTEFIDVLDDAKYYGHELALHGNEHTGSPYISECGCIFPIGFPSFRKQKETIGEGVRRFFNLFNMKPIGFRAPYYLNNNSTYKALSELNFVYDSSKTIFKPCYYNSIRIRTMSKITPFKINNIVEFPVSGDYTYRINETNFSFCLKAALQDFNLVKNHRGIFVMNNHPNDVNVDLMLKFTKKFLNITNENTIKSLNNIIT